MNHFSAISDLFFTLPLSVFLHFVSTPTAHAHSPPGATIAEIQRQTGVIIKTSDRNAGDAVNRTVNLTGTVPAQQMALQLVQQAIASDAGALTAFVASQVLCCAVRVRV
jgi:hypothetical protein